MIPIDQENVRLLERRLRGFGVDRRSFLKVAAAAVSGPAALSLLAACGGDDDDDEGQGAPTATTADETEPTATSAEEAEPTEAQSEPTEAESDVEPTEAEAEATEAEVAATATEADSSSSSDEEQTFYDIYLTSDPASHDFNAGISLQRSGFPSTFSSRGSRVCRSTSKVSWSLTGISTFACGRPSISRVEKFRRARPSGRSAADHSEWT